MNRINKILLRLEHLGNRLPHPTLLFVYLCGFVLLVSMISAGLGWQAVNPSTSALVEAKSLLSGEGIRWILTHTVSNFIGFAPVGTVLVAIMGIGIAEHSGLLAALLRKLVQRAKGNMLTAAIIFAGIFSSLGADSGYVVLIPLAALSFMAAGRHPLAGIAAAFAGVSGGYSANLLIGPFDAILSGLSTAASQPVAEGSNVSASANYFFMLASTLLITVLGTWVNSRFVEPRLSMADIDSAASPSDTDTEGNALSSMQADDAQSKAAENRGLLAVSLFSTAFFLLILAGLWTDTAPLMYPENSAVLKSAAIKGIVTLIAIYAALAGILFGFISGRYQKASQWIEGMEASMATIASYLVLMFFAAQFVNWFNWSQLGLLIALEGANWLTAHPVHPSLLLAAFVFFAGFINLFIGSGSAKWALLAPVFVPMLFLAGIPAEATQVAFRIGDSSTNIITPLMPYFGVVLAFAQRYQANAGVGTLLSLMLPYSVVFILAWTLLLSLWLSFGLPLGF